MLGRRLRAIVATCACAGGCHLLSGVADLEFVTCRTAADCDGAPCADGYCCDRACDGDCESCARAGSEGLCLPSAAGTADCAAGMGVCDGAGRCAIGAAAWAARIGDDADQEALGVAAIDGMVFVAGAFSGTPSPLALQTTADDVDGFVASLDDGGAFVSSASLRDAEPTLREQRIAAVGAAEGRLALAGTCHTAEYRMLAVPCEPDAPDGFSAVVRAEGLGPVSMDPSWKQLYGSAMAAQHASAVALDAAGRLVVAGAFDGELALDGSMLVADQTDAFVAAYTGNLTYDWSERLGGSGADRAHATAIDAAGRVIVAGEYGGSFAPGDLPPASGGSRVFVSVFDATGQHRWSRGFGSDGASQRALALSVRAGSEIVVGGSFAGEIHFERALAAVGDDDAFVALLGPDGTPRWSVPLGGADDETVRAVAVDDRGNVVVAGSFRGTLTVGGRELRADGSDAFVVKLSGDGNHLWSASDGGAGDDAATAVATDASGNVYVAGGASGALGFGAATTPAPAGGLDAFVVKLSP